MEEYNITLKKTLLHFWKICVHKYWVAYYCFKCGLYWQGLTHDLSKFSWTEFWESVRYYQGDSSPINVAKRENGVSYAWLHHKGRNPHHYEYWTDRYDDGTLALPMPYKYAAEMICDYLGAARAYMGKNFSYISEYNWWWNKINIYSPKMAESTKDFVTSIFLELYDIEKEPVYVISDSTILNKQHLLEVYCKVTKEHLKKYNQ